MAAPLTVALVGSGPSVKNQEIKGDVIIAVNSAIQFCRPHIWFTLDPSKSNQKIWENPLEGVQYIAAIPDRVITPPHVIRLNRIEGPGLDELPISERANPQLFWARRWKAKFTLSEDPKSIHTGNSLWGALQLYYLFFKYASCVIYGLDGTYQDRVTGGRPLALNHLPLLFESALPQLRKDALKVYNANPNSKVRCFEFLGQSNNGIQ